MLSIKIKYILLLIFCAVSLFAYSQPLSGYKICIDPGHGGHDPENDRQIELPHGLEYWESEGNFETALHLDTMLRALGADVMLTRTTNLDASDISLSERSAIANTFGADYFNSIHTNAYNESSNYSLVLYKGENDNPVYYDAKVMAGIMGKEIVDLLYPNTYYVRGDMSFLGFYLGVLKNTDMPASLSEGAFHDVPEEGLRLKNSAYLSNYAWAIAKSYCEYFGTSGFSTGRLGGIITDAGTGEPINGVLVSTSTGKYSYLGDEQYNGFYALSEMVPGAYQVTFKKEGYIDKTVEIEISANTYTEQYVELQYYNNGYPNINFSINKSSVSPGDTVTFDATASYDDGEIVSYEWNFGDNTSASGVTVSHVYTADETYPVSLTVTDNEGNASNQTKYITVETTSPDALTLLEVSANSGGGIKISWDNSGNTYQTGVRIYTATANDLSDFSLVADENEVDAAAGEYVINPTMTSSGLCIKISAVNSAGESDYSDSYAYYKASQETSKKVLIVDGYDREGGSYGGGSQIFTAFYMQNMRDYDLFNVESCANEAVTNDSVDLNNYDVVWWYVGDESTSDETFSSTEQGKIESYLEGGGNLLVTGSEIGWDLVKKGGDNDKYFYANYLKASFSADGGSGRSPATGISGGDFEGVSLPFGVVYAEDYPDELKSTGGSTEILEYATGAYAGVSYKGTFGSSSKNGGVVYVGFPLETVEDRTELTRFANKVFDFFDCSTEIENTSLAEGIVVYPTVFSTNINLLFKQSLSGKTTLTLFDNIQHKIYHKKLDDVVAGEIETISVQNVSSGIYFLQIQNKEMKDCKKLIKQ